MDVLALQNLSDQLKLSARLPQIPKVMQELIESFSNEDVDTSTIVSSISKDQAIAAKVLRLANSARFGAGRNIGTVNDAVIFLGFDTLRTLVLACGLNGCVTAPEGFDLQQFWTKSFTVATLCKLSIRKGEHPEWADQAFMGGLLHDFASPVIAASDLDLSAAGVNDNGYGCHRWSAALANHWRFPKAIVEGLWFQNEPKSAPKEALEEAHLACSLHFSVTLYAQYSALQESDATYSPEDLVSFIHSNSAYSAKSLKLADDQLLEVIHELPYIADEIKEYAEL